jgi:hypothetical protein
MDKNIINNTLIRIISERVNLSVGETKQMIVELAELIQEEREGLNKWSG